MRLSRITIGLLFAAALIPSIFTAVPANAQASNTDAVQGVSLSPALVELNAARGNTYNITIKVTNVAASDLVYSSSVSDFNAADESGSPHVIIDDKLPVTSSVRTWVVAIPEFTLRAHQSKVITAQIVVPNNAEPGGHYGVLRFSGKVPVLTNTGVGLSASAGVLMLIRVDGIITEKASLTSFFTSQNGKQSSFFESGPITFVTRVNNGGNIHVKPIGNVELRDMFGNPVSILTVNNDKSNVLPSSIRRFESNYNNTWMFGMYTANLTLGYGTTGQAIVNTITFWVLPYKLMLVGLLITATLIFIITRLIKVYNRHIIEKSKHENTIKTKKRKNHKG